MVHVRYHCRVTERELIMICTTGSIHLHKVFYRLISECKWRRHCTIALHNYIFFTFMQMARSILLALAFFSKDNILKKIIRVYYFVYFISKVQHRTGFCFTFCKLLFNITMLSFTKIKILNNLILDEFWKSEIWKRITKVEKKTLPLSHIRIRSTTHNIL